MYIQNETINEFDDKLRDLSQKNKDEILVIESNHAQEMHKLNQMKVMFILFLYH